MKTCVEFRSDRFPAYPDEEQQINPGIWGKQLAEFVSAGLKSRGIAAGKPVAEDWGWLVPIENESFPLWIGCANYDDGFLCFIEPSKPFIRRYFKKISTESQVSAVAKALDSLLASEASVGDVRWWTRQEWDHPRTEHDLEENP